MKTIKKYIVLSFIFTVLFQCLSFGQGSTYAGAFRTSTQILYYNGYNNQTIDGLQIANPASGRCIALENSTNVTIQNCKFGPSQDVAIYLYKCTNITIKNCTFENIASGLLAEYSSGIKFIYNDVKNCLGPTPGRGQMAHLVNCSGGGNQINFNSCENISGQSSAEDIINLGSSDGIVGDPIQVKGNWLRGGGPSSTGGGIMTGDSGGSWQLVEDNICVNTGNYGIANAGGHDIIIRNNKIYSAKTDISNVGLYVWNQQSGLTSYNITIENNQVLWNSKNGGLNNFWNAENSGTVVGWSTNTSNSTLNSAILPTIIIGRAKGVTTEISSTVPSTNEIKIYPNPATDHITIETSQTVKNGSISIYNIKGQKLIEQSLKIGNTDLDTQNLALGVYIMRISINNNQTEEKKLIIGAK